MTKYLISLMFLFCLVATAQPTQSVVFVSSDPSGVCGSQNPLQYNYTNGKLWGCKNNVWTQTNSGGATGCAPAGTITDVLTDTGSGGCNSNVATLSTGGSLSTPGSGSFGVGGTTAGFVYLAQGTAPGSFSSSGVTIFSPTSVTAYGLALPTAAASGILRGSNSSNTVTLSQSEISGDCTTSGSNAITCLKTNGTSFGTAALQNTGTSGAVVPLLNASNIWSGLQLFNAAVSATGYSTATNCSSGASPAVCGSASAGAVALPTGVGSVTLQVNTNAISSGSRILLASDDTLTISGVTCNSTLATLVGGLTVTSRTTGLGGNFVISYNGTIATNPLCVSYFIVN